MHQDQGLPGSGVFGSTTQATQPSTVKVWRVKPFQVSIFSPGHDTGWAGLGPKQPQKKRAGSVNSSCFILNFIWHPSGRRGRFGWPEGITPGVADFRCLEIL
jgi:hypothetical protein